MSTPSREEIDAKLALVEARIETRLVSMDSKMDLILDRVAIGTATAERAERAASNIKWNVLFAALGTLGVILAAILALGELRCCSPCL